MILKNTLKTVLAVTLLGLFACGEVDTLESDTQPLDSEHSSFGAVDGKADSNGPTLSTEEIDTILDIVNTYSFDELDEFLNVRAVRNIVEARAEGPIKSIAQLDAISWVGPKALELLRDEARGFLSDSPEVFEVSELLEVVEEENRFGRTLKRIRVHGQLAEALTSQGGLGFAFTCRQSSCTLKSTLDSLNDYTERAEPGHIAVSFRTGDLSSTTQARNFNSMARRVINQGNEGPMECKEVDTNAVCVPLYGCGRTFRCGIRLPE